MLSQKYIKNLAVEAGFDLCGVAPCRRQTDGENYFRHWLDSGYSGGLAYLSRNTDVRFDPSRLVADARTVVVCAISYRNDISAGYPDSCRTKIASYACTADYHDTIRRMLRGMLATMRNEYPDLQGRAFVDSAPLLEKQFAIDAGLGRRGRQSLLVTPQYGTFVLLGELVLDKECDQYDAPMEGAGCGECRRCVESCPVGAILQERAVDASRCISCATVEANARKTDGEEYVEKNLHGWIFGCDECQSCCPYNRNALPRRSALMEPLFDPRSMDAGKWLEMSDEEFSERFGTTPLARSGPEAIKRNLK